MCSMSSYIDQLMSSFSEIYTRLEILHRNKPSHHTLCDTGVITIHYNQIKVDDLIPHHQCSTQAQLIGGTCKHFLYSTNSRFMNNSGVINTPEFTIVPPTQTIHQLPVLL